MATFKVKIFNTSEWKYDGQLIIEANNVKKGELDGEIIVDGIHIVCENEVNEIIKIQDKDEALKEIGRYRYNNESINS
jgi:hypothetical protein